MIKPTIKIEFGNKIYDGATLRWTHDVTDYFLSLQKISAKEVATFGEMVRMSIERNLYASRTYYNAPVAPNAPSTIIRKGHGKVFFDKGILYRSIAVRNYPKSTEIFIEGERSVVAPYLQEGTARMPKREFFGIMPERAESMLRDIFTAKMLKAK